MRKLRPGQRLYAALVLAHVADVKRSPEIGCDNTTYVVIMTTSTMVIEFTFIMILMIAFIITVTSMFVIIAMTILDISPIMVIDLKSSPET